MDNETKRSLENYFDFENAGLQWNMFCKKCKRGWSLPNDNAHPGNVLKLLDHAYSHKNKRRHG